MNAVAPLAALGDPTGVFIDNDDLAVPHDVFPVALNPASHTDGPLHKFVEPRQFLRRELRRLGKRAQELTSGGGELDLFANRVAGEVFFLDEARGDLSTPLVGVPFGDGRGARARA